VAERGVVAQRSLAGQLGWPRDSDARGSLIVKVEHRQELGDLVAPASLAGEIGYLGVTGTLFSDEPPQTLGMGKALLHKP
jgi:hypothetical protein